MSAPDTFSQAVHTVQNSRELYEQIEKLIRLSVGTPIYRNSARQHVEDSEYDSYYESSPQVELLGMGLETTHKDAYGFAIYLVVGVDGTAAAVAGRDAHDGPSLYNQFGEFGHGYHMGSPSTLSEYQTFAQKFDNDVSYMAHVLYTSLDKPHQIEELIDDAMQLAKERMQKRLKDRERVFNKLTSAFKGLDTL